MTNAKIIADSYNPLAGRRLTTVQCHLPAIGWYDISRHGLLSKAASSTRAENASALCDRVEATPYIPDFTKNTRGMAGATLHPQIKSAAEQTARHLLLFATLCHRHLQSLGIAKQDANPYLFPWLHVDVVLTATEWRNFTHLRGQRGNSRPCVKDLTEQIRQLLDEYQPEPLAPGQWHLPYVTPKEKSEHPTTTLKAISAARVATASYDFSAKPDIERDLQRYQLLTSEGHWEPLMHVATPFPGPYSCSNLVGWFPHRKEFPEEANGDLAGAIPITAAHARQIMTNPLNTPSTHA